MGLNSYPDLSDLTEVDRLIHEPARMAIMAALFGCDSADFRFLLNVTGLTKGNLSAHASKLEDAGYIQIEKSFRGKMPQTTYRLTRSGRAAFSAYRAKLKVMLGALG
jgi:DNA-binding MarR family transcriptional regulator